MGRLCLPILPAVRPGFKNMPLIANKIVGCDEKWLERMVKIAEIMKRVNENTGESDMNGIYSSFSDCIV